MKITILSYWAILFLFIYVKVIGQDHHCNEIIDDTTKCFIQKKYIKPRIVLEKKWESQEIALIGQVPLVADMDGDCLPEILMRGISTFDLSKPDTQRVQFFNGRNGSLKEKFECGGFNPYLTPVLADVDNDGIREILFSSEYGGSNYWAGFIRCYEFSGRLKWESDEYFYNSNYNPGHATFGVADFNQDGKSEVYCHNRIFNGQTGKMLVEGGINGIGASLYFNGNINIFYSLSVAAQLDNDPCDLELAAGYSIYKVKISNLNGKTGNQMIPINIKVDNKYLDGITAIADINGDSRLEVIVSYSDRYITQSRLYAYNLSNDVPILIAQNYIPGKDERNGCPTIADIDGNGIPNILVSKHNLIHNFEYNGTNTLNLKWSLVVNDTFSTTGISCFDLDGDGIQEIIYRDHINLLLIDGKVSPPQIIDSIRCLAGTFFEYPTIADIDNSGEAKICIVCRGTPPLNFLGCLTAFGSPDSLPGWAPARAVWNQYAYNPLYINDDLTVPRVPKNQANYKNGKYNNILQQESLLDSNGMYKVAAASLWGTIDCINFDPLTEDYTVTFNVFNHKNATAGVDSAMPVSFYNGDPATIGSLLGIYHTQVPLDPGDSLTPLEFKFEASQINHLYMVINTRRDTSGAFEPKDFSALECDYADNVFHTKEFPKIQKTSASICQGSSYTFYDSLLFEQGLYIHTLNNQKGCDSLIALLELVIVDTVHSLQTLSVCDSFKWDGVVYRENGTFVNHFQTSAGCDSVVTLNLSIRHSSDTLIDKTACRKYDFNDKVYTKGGRYFIKIRNRQGCDSTIELNLSIVPLDTNVTKLNNTLTALDSLATYQWVDCDEDYAPVVNATQRSYTPVRSGNYGVILSSPPCSDTTVCIQVIVTHAFNENEHLFLIYPNPATSKLYVQLPDGLTGNVILAIYDIHGRDLFKRSWVREGQDFMEVDVSCLGSGMYFVYLQSIVGASRMKFIKI
ncbi:MAG: T9SS type A sorting domain-containing protein [Saprospiraceae bacterium]|nr:T9SS type A sorting domain-containing protein [Saprospiraceae bacterium]